MAKMKLGANVGDGRRVDMELTFDDDHPEDVIGFIKGLASEEQLKKFLTAYLHSIEEDEDE
jgi:hypothetical protein